MVYRQSHPFVPLRATPHTVRSGLRVAGAPSYSAGLAANSLRGVGLHRTVTKHSCCSTLSQDLDSPMHVPEQYQSLPPTEPTCFGQPDSWPFVHVCQQYLLELEAVLRVGSESDHESSQGIPKSWTKLDLQAPNFNGRARCGKKTCLRSARVFFAGLLASVKPKLSVSTFFTIQEC